MSCEQNLWTKVLNKRCEQVLWTWFVNYSLNKSCEQKLWTNVVSKSCEHELSCEQWVVSMSGVFPKCLRKTFPVRWVGGRLRNTENNVQPRPAAAGALPELGNRQYYPFISIFSFFFHIYQTQVTNIIIYVRNLIFFISKYWIIIFLVLFKIWLLVFNNDVMFFWFFSLKWDTLKNSKKYQFIATSYAQHCITASGHF